MNPRKSPLGGADDAPVTRRVPVVREDRPLTVRDAASFLGVSPQTVYLWVERKQIPHLRVMGRNIRFLRSDLEPFREQFKQAVEWQDR
jgi:excisionase family DNA binding protein